MKTTVEVPHSDIKDLRAAAKRLRVSYGTIVRAAITLWLVFDAEDKTLEKKKVRP
jgi:hypothetical protein